MAANWRSKPDIERMVGFDGAPRRAGRIAVRLSNYALARSTASFGRLDLPNPSGGRFRRLFFGAIFEEIGWTGYATMPLQERYGIVGAGLIIGAVWALWHVVPWWLGQGRPLSWVAGQFIATIFMRIIMGWIYAYGGQSLFLAIVFHAMINTSYNLFPNGDSHYDPSVLAAVLAIMTAMIAFAHPIMRRSIQ